MRRRHGPPVWMEINVRLARGGTRNASVSYVLVMRDVSARKELEQQLKALANTDGLTNLLNRRAFDEGVEREWKRALRDGTALSLLLLDIDHFKSFNDSYGHQAGDDCLRRVASVIMGALRVTDIVARYGGEEFVAILPSTDRNGALRAAETVRASIAALEITHLDNCEGSGRVSVSLGVASTTPAHTGRAMSAQLLLKTADNALYEAKRSGRNRIAAANVRE